MTIAEQVQEIVEEMCKDYCKWPDVYDEEIEYIGHETPLIGTNTIIDIIDKHIGGDTDE